MNLLMKPVCIYNGTVLTGLAAMEQCAVLIEDGLISDVFSQKRFEQRKFDSSVRLIDAGGSFIAPGFIDTHIHGIGGYGTEDSKTESILEMSRLLADRGVTAFNPTIYADAPGRMLETIRKITAAMGEEEEEGARVMGLHLEGPFISPERLGVQKPETVQAVNLDLMEQFWQASSGHIVNMTVAPELKHMRELALYCGKKGIVLQAGHTNADYDNMKEGMQAGILHSTHLFNAMRRLDHRNPNAVGAILIHPEMSCEIIADGFHVHPDLFKLLLRNKPIDKIVLITDGLKPTEQKEGPFYANNEEVYFKGGIFYRKADNVIAGSGLTMIRGIRNLTNAGFSVNDAVKTAAFNPAQIMRYNNQGAIIPGRFADITVFDGNFNISLVMIGGKIIKE
ncbi:MAG: N-acetylglucosamine-6-phosphate deacetylase [Treponema sp.]|nr:N-acetylglucosamine-6-phosphate deacetylase [Treponema sp.]